jgi:hypothetical protein
MQKFRVYVETSFVVEAEDDTSARQLVGRKLDCAAGETIVELFANMRSSDDWDVAKED